MKYNTSQKSLSLLLFLGLSTSAVAPMSAYASGEDSAIYFSQATEETTEEAGGEGGEAGGEAGETYAGEEATEEAGGEGGEAGGEAGQ